VSLLLLIVTAAARRPAAWRAKAGNANLPRWVSAAELRLGPAGACLRVTRQPRAVRRASVPGSETGCSMAASTGSRASASVSSSAWTASVCSAGSDAAARHLIAVAASWSEVESRPGFFQANLLWTLAGVCGVFLALDLLLFFLFWEVMLIPMYLLIAIWGHENRGYAAMKFFIFTQVSGLLMLLAIVALAWQGFMQRGEMSFSYGALLGLTCLRPWASGSCSGSFLPSWSSCRAFPSTPGCRTRTRRRPPPAAYCSRVFS
jgi:NADH-quinone oxidoreductase subunit M